MATWPLSESLSRLDSIQKASASKMTAAAIAGMNGRALVKRVLSLSSIMLAILSKAIGLGNSLCCLDLCLGISDLVLCEPHCHRLAELAGSCKCRLSSSRPTFSGVHGIAVQAVRLKN